MYGLYRFSFQGFSGGRIKGTRGRDLFSLLEWHPGWVSGREVGEKSSQITGSEGGGWWEPSSLLVGPVLSFLTACSPLLRSREADLVDRTAYPLGEGGAPLG